MKNYTSTSQQEADRANERKPQREFIPYGTVKRLIRGKVVYLTKEQNAALNKRAADSKAAAERRKLEAD